MKKAICILSGVFLLFALTVPGEHGKNNPVKGTP